MHEKTSEMATMLLAEINEAIQDQQQRVRDSSNISLDDSPTKISRSRIQILLQQQLSALYKIDGRDGALSAVFDILDNAESGNFWDGDQDTSELLGE